MANINPTLSAPQRATLSASSVINRIGWIVAQVLLWAFFLSVALPILWTIVTSFKTSRELFADPWALPAVWQTANYVKAWAEMKVGTYFFNSVFVNFASLAVTMLFGAMAAYVIARVDIKINRGLYFFFLAGWLIPYFLTVIPAWFLHRSLGTISKDGGHAALIIQYAASSLPFTVFFLYSFFKTLPKELEESALIDGATPYQTFFQVMLPLARSGLLTIAVFNFIGIWNEYPWALVTISRDELKTLPLGMANLLQRSQYQTDWGAMFAGFVITLVPTFLIYIVYQSRLTEGITVGAVKG
jgi:N-acetylglucosamine transport system permease protein